MKRIFLSLILTAATLPWATAALAQQDPSEAPATRPVNPVSAPQKLIFVPDSMISTRMMRDGAGDIVHRPRISCISGKSHSETIRRILLRSKVSR